MPLLKIGFFLFLAFIWTEAKIYTNCEFAQAMKANGVTSQLGTWTCIAFHESSFNTNAVNTVSGDYGILQINHYFWCSETSTPGKSCNITCQSLLNDDITEDITCAKQIYSETAEGPTENGFTAWVTYDSCTGDQSSWISGCDV